jgi:hypothetical protein
MPHYQELLDWRFFQDRAKLPNGAKQRRSCRTAVIAFRSPSLYDLLTISRGCAINRVTRNAAPVRMKISY